MTATQDQINKIIPLLSHDRASNFYQIQAYLRTILLGNSVKFVISKQETIVLSPQDAWQVISDWGKTPDANLPVGERGSIKTLAGRLLGYIETNLVGRTSEAASAYYAMLDQAKTPLAPAAAPTPELDSYQKANALRKQLTDAINAKFLGKLTTELEQSRYLQRIPDLHTRSMVAAFLAANAANLRHADEHLPEKINQMLLARAGDKELNNAIHLLYSQLVHDQKDLEQITEIIEKRITESYASDQEFIADQRNLRSIAALSPTLDNLPTLIDHLAPNATAKQKQILSATLRQEIVLAARGQHTKGFTILSKAFYKAGLAGEPSSLSILNPIIEELETSTRYKLLGSSLRDRDSRVLSTYNLAAKAGVDPLIPWMKERDLQAIENKLLAGTTLTDINQALLVEYDWQDRYPGRIAEISDLISLKKQYHDYHQLVSDNPLFAIRDLWAKGRGTIAAGTEPYQKVVHKAYSAFEKVDDIINWPARTLVNFWEKAVEASSIPIGKKGFRFALLDPAGSLYKGWINLQKNYASRIATWANGFVPGKWYSGFFRQIGDFSSAFVKADANWSQANFFFFQKKWGNVLDWGAQRIFKQKTFAELQVATLKLIQSAGNKFAAGLGDKIASVIGTATSEAGIGLIILGAQVLWEVGKHTLGKLKNYLASILGGDSKNLFGFVPLALGGLFLAVNAALGGIPIILLAALEVLRAALKLLWETLVTLFILAVSISIGLILVMVLLFNAFKTTTNLDSGIVQLASNILCDEGGSGGGNPNINAGVCIAKVLAGCGINPLNNGNANSPKWQCALASFVAPSAMEALKRSASSYDVLQCVGLIAAIDILNGGSGQFTDAKNLDTIVPAGYRFASGVGSCSPGDFFVDKNGDWGHTGVFVSNAGPYIRCIDANGGGPGIVRDDKSCVWPTSRIAGCLKKN